MSDRHQESRFRRPWWAGRVLFSALLCTAAGLRAQTLGIPFQRLSTEQGLSQSTVNCILQDRTGFIWLGTQDGLNRYDGYSFRVYKNDPTDPSSLSANWIEALVEDAAGDLWIGTQGGGLARWRRASDTFERFRHDPDDPASLPGNSVRTLLVDRADTLWIGTFQSGLARRVESTGKFERFRHDPNDPTSLADDRVRAIHEDRAGKLWIGTLGGLNRLDVAAMGGERGSFERYRHDPEDEASLSDDRVFSILQDSGGSLWVGTEDGLNRLVPIGMGRGFERFRHDPEDPASLADNWVPGLLEDDAGRLWIATDGGLHLRRSDGSFARYRHDSTDPLSLSGDRLLAIYQDRGGVLWVGTQGSGVNKWHPVTWSFVHYRAAATGGLSNDNVVAFSEDEEGRLYIGTLGGLDVLERASGRFTHYRHDPADPSSLPGDQVTALYHDRSGALWVGTQGRGLGRLEPAVGASGRRTFRNFRHYPDRPGSLSNNDVSAIVEDRSGILWVATFRGGLERFVEGSFQHSRHDPDDPESLSDDHLTALAVGPDGSLWVGTFGGGINWLEGSGDGRARFRHLRHDPERPESLSSDTIYTLHFDAAGDLWAGTQVGLNRLEALGAEPRVRHYFERDGLPSNVVWGIQSDGVGRLWLSTNHGLSRFDPRTEELKNYDKSHGLQSNEFNFGAHFRSRSGELFFGGLHGFNAFRPDRITRRTTAPPVVVTRFTKLNQAVDPGRPIFDVDLIELGWRDDFFDVEFAALDYAAPGENRYRYKLEGFNGDWIDIGQRRRVTFTNLDPGPYVLRLRGSNNDGVWNEQGASLEISVEPPPWETWWAYSFYGLVLAAVVWGLARLHHDKVEGERAIARRERAQAEERDRLIAELERKNSELERFNYTASHDLRTPLVTIKGFLGHLAQDAASGNADRLQADIRHIGTAADRMSVLLDELLEFARIGRQANPPELVSLDEVAGEALELVGGLVAERAVAVEIASELPTVLGDRLRLRAVFQNLLENAVKYMGAQRSPRIEVGMRRHGPMAAGTESDPVVYVCDNGIGIDPRYHEKVFGLFERLDATDEGTGVGLALVKRIVEAHGGRIWVESDGLGRGCTFCLGLGRGGRGAEQSEADAEEPVSAPVTAV